MLKHLQMISRRVSDDKKRLAEMIPLPTATPATVPLVDPSLFGSTIEQMLKHHVIAGRVHEADFYYFRDLGPHHVFCDIGANLGASVISLGAAGGRCPVHSFEINPALYPTLRKMAATTPNHWRLHEYGLGERAGKESIYIAKAGDLYILGEGTLRLDFLQEPASLKRLGSYTVDGKLFVGRMEVEVRRFDDCGIIPTHVKMDAEGAEATVLRGMTQTLKVHRPIMMIENGDIGHVDEIMFAHDYKPFQYDVGSGRLISRIQNVQNSFYVHKAKLIENGLN
jgi:FkbM family methyltransferase